MKTSKIAFGAALILGIVFFPAHMIMIGIFLVLVAMAIGFISIALKTNDEINSSISDDDAFMAYYLLEKRKINLKTFLKPLSSSVEKAYFYYLCQNKFLCLLSVSLEEPALEKLR